MTSELVERLRAERDRMWKECRLPTKRTYTTATPDMLGQAAAEIERLTAQLAEARQADRALALWSTWTGVDVVTLRREAEAA